MFHREKDGRKGVLLNVNRAGIYIYPLDIGGVGMNFARGNISSKLLLIVEPNLCGALRDGTWIDIENFKKLTILAKRLR